MRKKIASVSLGVVVAVLILNILGIVKGWYVSNTWYDIIPHFLGGFWVSITSLLFIPERWPVKYKILAMLGAVLVIGMGWEVFEYAMTFISGDTLDDSPEDIVVDMAGGVLAVLYARRFFKV